jgi:hypothetical protein
MLPTFMALTGMHDMMAIKCTIASVGEPGVRFQTPHIGGANREVAVGDTEVSELMAPHQPCKSTSGDLLHL